MKKIEIKSKEKTKEIWEQRIMSFSLGIGIALIVAGFYLFAMGFHNLDLSWNMLRVAYNYDLDYYSWVDAHAIGKDGNFKTITYDEGYIMGSNQMIKALVLVFTGCLIFASSLTTILAKLTEKN